MKNSAGEFLSSYRQWLMEKEQQVYDIEKTIDDFRKDQQEIVVVMNAKVAALRKDIVREKKKWQNAFDGLMVEVNITGRSTRDEATPGISEDLLQNRADGAPDWNNIHETTSQTRNSDVVKPPKSVRPMTLENKVLDYISKHPMGVKVSEMEEPLNETRMKLGYTAKGLLDEGKVQKFDNIYYPVKCP